MKDSDFGFDAKLTKLLANARGSLVQALSEAVERQVNDIHSELTADFAGALDSALQARSLDETERLNANVLELQGEHERKLEDLRLASTRELEELRANSERELAELRAGSERKLEEHAQLEARATELESENARLRAEGARRSAERRGQPDQDDVLATVLKTARTNGHEEEHVDGSAAQKKSVDEEWAHAKANELAVFIKAAEQALKSAEEVASQMKEHPWNAAEELLPEEKRWKKWSFEELQAECGRRGVFGGREREQCLTSLLEVKRWEGLSSKDIKAECSKRGLTVDSCQDKDDLLVQLKRDFSWENMGEDDLREELIRQRIPLPDPQEQTAMDRTMRSRLRQVHRWETMPVSQLRRACDLRNFDAEGKSREQALEFLKSFKIYPKPKPTPKPSPGPSQHQSQHQSHHQSHHQQQHNQARRPGAGGSDVDGSDSENGQEFPSGLNDRVRRHCRKYPRFEGPFPLEMNHWTDQDIEMYLYSNGFLKPGRKTEKASGVPKKLHYKTLGLPDGAPANDVRKAYRKLALVYHPDKNPDDPESAAETFKAITEAYETLTSSFAKEPNCG